MAVRVGFEPTGDIEDLQVTDSSLPGLPYLPVLPSRIAHHCPRRRTLSRSSKIAHDWHPVEKRTGEPVGRDDPFSARSIPRFIPSKGSLCLTRLRPAGGPVTWSRKRSCVGIGVRPHGVDIASGSWMEELRVNSTGNRFGNAVSRDGLAKAHSHLQDAGLVLYE